MNKLPFPIWFISGATVATLIIGFVTDNNKLLLSGLVGVILTAAAIAKYWTRNDPPSDEDEDTLDRW
jgi:hypothetical protein